MTSRVQVVSWLVSNIPTVTFFCFCAFGRIHSSTNAQVAATSLPTLPRGMCTRSSTSTEIVHALFALMHDRLLTPFPLCCRGAVCWRLALLQEIVPIMDLAVNEEFTRMFSEEELMGSRRIQVRVETMKD